MERDDYFVVRAKFLKPGDRNEGPFLLLTIFLGIILAVHLSMNGKVGSALANPRVGNAGLLVHRRADRCSHSLSGWRSGV